MTVTPQEASTSAPDLDFDELMDVTLEDLAGVNAILATQ